MNRTQLTRELVKLIDSLPDEVLPELLAYLRACQGRTARDLRLSHHLATILREDRQLLQRLAQ